MRFKKLNKEYILLIFIFLIVFSFNFFYSLKTEEFTGGDSYTNLRKIESINQNLIPMFWDELSYSGRNHFDLPLFYYLLSIFSFFMPIYLVGKLIPALLISTLCIIVYFISFHITKKSNVSLISAFMAAFIPSIILLSFNQISVYSLLIPLLFLSFYFFMRINEGIKFIIFFIISFIFCMITHPMSFILIFTFLIYFLIKKIEGSNISKIEVEVVIFVSFFILWAYFIVYKDLLLLLGPNAIWQSIPSYVRSNFFQNFDILTAILKIGILPFLFGIYIIYSFFFNFKNNYLYVSFPLSVLLLLWLKLIQLEVGLSLLGVSLVILFPHFFNLFLNYFEKTKWNKYENYILILVAIIFIFSSVLPSIVYANENLSDSFNDDEIKAMEWILNNTKKDSVILSSEIEGSLISYKTQRKNVLDTTYLKTGEADKRLKNVRTIYTTLFETEAIPLLVDYEVDYILVSDRIKNYFDIDNIKYISSQCFELVYSNKVQIFRSRCRMEVV
jgi:hypothetical protein